MASEIAAARDKARVIHVTEGLELGLGGTTQYVADLCAGLCDQGLEVGIWARGQDGAARVQVDPRLGVRCFQSTGPRSLGRCPDFDRALQDCLPLPDLLHVHGLWLDPYRVAARFARRRGTPLAISLHGMLEPWARRHRRWKKAIAWLAYQRRDLQRASCLHVATAREAGNARALGLRTPIAVIPNGIPPGDESSAADRGLIDERYPTLAGKRFILSLGRLHPVKGLDLLARAWAGFAPEFDDWHWAIAGPDEDGHRAQLEQLLGELGLAGRATFLGPVAGPDKAALLHACELLALPSKLESFGLVVLEAFRAGRPVMLSTDCPWPDIESRDCGWWLPRDAPAWEEALRRAAALPAERLATMGRNGRSWVEEEFSQARAVRAMLSLYQWLLGHEPRPAFVHLP